MTAWSSNDRVRRLPVFFLLDTSKNMQGTFEVTMQTGLLKLISELKNHHMARRNVRISIITFEHAKFDGLESLDDDFRLPAWQAQGQCALKPALDQLIKALMGLDESLPDIPGDYAPLVFLILGSRPSDQWQEVVGILTTFIDNRRPFIITLITREDATLVRQMGTISHHVFSLHSPKAEYITRFFFWTAQAIKTVLDDYNRGSTSIKLPTLPNGVIMKN